MQETRRARLAAVIQEELSMLVARELRDPRIPPVTFTEVQLTPDGSQATVYVAILGAGLKGPEDAPAEGSSSKRMKECLEGLTSASGFLRRHIGKVLTVRHTPSLIFREDRGFENSIRVHELLKKITDTQ